MTTFQFFRECSGIVALIAIFATLIAVALDWFPFWPCERRDRRIFQGKWSDSKSTHKLYQTRSAQNHVRYFIDCPDLTQVDIQVLGGRAKMQKSRYLIAALLLRSHLLLTDNFDWRLYAVDDVGR
jgi:hypothetical protein